MEPSQRVVPELSYLICTVPRSGSYLLAEALESTGIAGQPKEYFDRRLVEFWDTRLARLPDVSADLPLLDKILMAGTTPNGVFGAKVHWYQFAEFGEDLLRDSPEPRCSLKRRIAGVLPGIRYVWLRRRDKIRQAISYYRAIKTDVWWDIKRHLPPDTQAHSQPEFDFAAIQALLQLIDSYEAHWQDYFRACHLQPMVLFYEDVASDVETATRSVLQYLNIGEASTVRVAPPRLRKQADHLTELWIASYRAARETAMGDGAAASVGDDWAD